MKALELALSYVERGLRVFPLTEGTGTPPRSFDWRERATTDPDLARRWWEARPHMNVAIVIPDGVAVLEAEPDAGAASLERLKRYRYWQPHTPEAQIAGPGAGVQLYLSVPADQVGGQVTRRGGITLKVAGDFVAVPPSQVRDLGVFAWTPGRGLADLDPEPLPGWMAEHIRQEER
jgi:hypothetical protein